MHDTAMAAGAAFFSTYFEGAAPRVLDIGALDLNGSLRAVAPRGCEYVGVDLAAGQGVDLVLAPGQALPFPTDSFHACVSVSCFEHDLMFWDTFLQMAAVIRAGGFIFLNAPSNGPYHRFPADNWRFYPDAGVALAAWARRQGQPIHLIESGILRRRSDVWNDFVAVFQKGDAPLPRNRFLVDTFPDAMNVYLINSPQIKNAEPITEDFRLFQESQSQTREHATEIEKLAAALAEEKTLVRSLMLKVAEKEADIMSQRRNAAEQRKINEELRQTLNQQQDCIDTMLASKSWRMTAPLRAARRMLSY
jgi:hypothetical protein